MIPPWWATSRCSTLRLAIPCGSVPIVLPLPVARSLPVRLCDVVLSDDGLQHYRLARTVEIVAIDAARGFGNGQLLPAGPLREPVTRPGRGSMPLSVSWDGMRRAPWSQMAGKRR